MRPYEVQTVGIVPGMAAQNRTDRSVCGWRSRQLPVVFLVLLLMPGVFQLSLGAQTLVLAVGGDQPPRARGTLGEFQVPVIHDDGSVAFASNLRDQGFLSGSGVFVVDGSAGELRSAALKGDPTPDVNGSIGDLSNTPVAMNGRGQVSFVTRLDGTLGGALDFMGLFRSDKDGLTMIARGNQKVNGEQTRFSSFYEPVSINGAGEVAFISDLRVPPALVPTLQGVYRSDGVEMVEIVRSGETAPDGASIFESFNLPGMGVGINGTGQVMFSARTTGFVDGIFRGDGTALVTLVREKDPSPDGNGSIFSFSPPAFNQRGEVAMVASLSGTDLGFADNTAIIRADGLSSVIIARKGDLLPDRNGRFLDFGTEVALNDHGKVAFVATITGASGGSSSGIFIGDGASLAMVVRNNQPAPKGGLFNGYGVTTFSLNNRGQMAFGAGLLQTAVPYALFFFDPSLGVFQVTAPGKTLGSLGAISSIFFNGGLGPQGAAHSGLNELGQITYSCFVGPTAAVVKWSPDGLARNRPPTASPFETLVNQGHQLRMSVSNLLSVAIDPDADELAIQSVDSVTHQGQPLTYNSFAKEYLYTPKAGFMGADEFTYIIMDEFGASVVVSGRITVFPPNLVPTARPFQVSARIGQRLTLEVADLLAVASDADGDPLSLGQLPVVTEKGGSIFRTGQVVTVNPVLTSGSDRFVYVVGDGRGGLVEVAARILPQNEIQDVSWDSGQVVIRWVGLFGTWRVERTTSPAGPWESVGSVQVGNDNEERLCRRGGECHGAGVFRDPAPLATSAFYRVVR